MNIFVTRLSYSTSSEDLKDLFSEYGEVTSSNVIIDKSTGRSKGFGFVEMSDDSEGQHAIDELNNCEFDGRTIVVKKAKPREGRSDGGGRDNKRF